MIAMLVFGLLGCSNDKVIDEQNKKLDEILEAVTKKGEIQVYQVFSLLKISLKWKLRY